MFYLALSVTAVLAILLLSELGWRKHWLDNELGRKFVHITVGSFVAFWPFFLSWTEIRLLSVAFLIVVIVSDRLKLFRAVHSVQRPTFGEICFAITVGALTFITHSKGVYATALLQMSLADGLAAVVGTRYGRHNSYHPVPGMTKSAIGTATFLVTSLALLIGYNQLGMHGLLPITIAAGAIGATLLENFAPLGIDNLLVPVFIGLLLANV